MFWVCLVSKTGSNFGVSAIWASDTGLKIWDDLGGSLIYLIVEEIVIH